MFPMRGNRPPQRQSKTLVWWWTLPGQAWPGLAAATMTFGVQMEKTVVRLFNEDYHVSRSHTCKYIYSKKLRHVMSLSTVKCIVKFWLKFGITPQQRLGAGKRNRTSGINRYRRAIERIVDDDAGLYLDEMSDLLLEETGTRFSDVTISRALRRYGYSLRTLYTKAAQRDELLHLECRMRLAQYDPRQLVFVDETHQDERQARRRRGWAKRGRVPTVFEALGSKRFTVIAACNLWGFVMDACETIELKPHQGVDGARFLEWVEQKLVPQLGSFMAGEKNSVVVLDNASVHKKELRKVVRAIRAAGAVVEFLSPYSPDLNPIEEAFSKVKKGCRRDRQLYLANAKSCIETALRSVTTQDFHGYFRHSGLDVPNLKLRSAVNVGVAAAVIVVAAVAALKKK